jgi:DNA polymerase iota
VVTCNYEARRRGLHKLELISEAKKKVPDLIIVLGEELGRFRDASKLLYRYLEGFTWSGKVEKLGFDEVFLDVTDIVDYNQNLLNPHDLKHSFFCLDRNDPTVGFPFDATTIAGHVYPPDFVPRFVPNTDMDVLTTRLTLGSHFAQRLRLGLEEEMGYTSTVGISTSKLLSKLVGNVHKPQAQTTLCPPYDTAEDDGGGHTDTTLESNVTKFIDSHEIGKIPGIGFKTAQRIRNHILSRAPEFGVGQAWGGTTESVSVRDVRSFASMGPELLEKILGGPGAERGIGGKIWGLIRGIDDVEVQRAKKIPTQISIEDSYGRIETMSQVLKELRMLATSLINRMHADLLEDDDEPNSGSKKRWLAYPKTVRLSTRPRPPPNDEGARTRSFNRISRSGPLPNFVFSVNSSVDAIAEKLVQECLVPMFKRLHSPQGGWNLSLINIGVTNMVETASDESGAGGRDIGKMFRRQEDVLKEWKVEDKAVPLDSIPGGASKAEQSEDHLTAEPSAGHEAVDSFMAGSEDTLYPTQDTIDEHAWEDEGVDDSHERCGICDAVMPAFAMSAHERFHNLDE